MKKYLINLIILLATMQLSSQAVFAAPIAANQSITLDFTNQEYIETESIFEMVCDSSGCSPLTIIRPIDLNIKALWNLDSLENGTAKDATTNYYDMSKSGDVTLATNSNCKHNSCLNFSGESVNYVYSGDSPFADTVGLDTGFTLSLWINPRQLSGYIFASTYSSRIFFKQSSGELVYYIEAIPANNQIRIDADKTAGLINTWTQLTYRYDNTTEQLSVFINGALYQTTQTNMESYKHSQQNFTLGNSMTHNAEDQFDGMVDEFVVYDTPLSDAAVMQLFTEDNPPTVSGAHFKTKELNFDSPIESFSGTIQDTNNATSAQFSTDGGHQWCDVVDDSTMDRKTYCYFPTDTLQLKFAPVANTTVQSFTLETSTENRYENKGNFPMGMNLAGMTYYSRQILFADAMKRATAFYAEPYPWWSPVKVDYTTVFDEQGYPLFAPMEIFDIDGNSLGEQGFVSHLYLHADGEYPTGEYILLFEGEGTVEIKNDAGNHTASSKGLSEVRYPFTITSTSALGFSITISQSNVNNPVRNIRIVVPGHEASYEANPFYQPFLEMFAGFESFRFMDLMHTNSQNLESWNDVRPVSYFSQSSEYPVYSGGQPGLSPEYLIMLANFTKADPWFCIPHKADDTYITNLAKLIHENLDPELQVYIEYSNELWNWMFTQTHYALAQGKALQLDDDVNVAMSKFILKRNIEIFKIFEDEFGQDRERLTTMLSGQSARVSILAGILSHLADPALNPHNIGVDAIAIAPYIHIDDEDVFRLAPTVNEITYRQVAQLALEGIFAHNEEHIAAHKTLAEQYGVQLIAYEGGQHLGFDLNPSDPVENDLITLYTGLNRDETIGVLTHELLNTWGHYTDGLFSYFSSIGSYGRYGSWGTYESAFEGETVKSKMLREWTDARQGNPTPLGHDYNNDNRIDLKDLILGLQILSGSQINLTEGTLEPGESIGLKDCLSILTSVKGK